MNIENETIEIYNSAIKQSEFLNLTLTKENIKKICECNLYAILQSIQNNNRILDTEKIILKNYYQKLSSKILSL